MKTVEYISPEGEVVEVPEADAAHFDAIGWERAAVNDVVEVPEADAAHFDAIGWERAAGNDNNANKKQTKK